MDVALFSNGGLVGFDNVLRGPIAIGAFISARVSSTRLTLQPLEAEVMSVREA